MGNHSKNLNELKEESKQDIDRVITDYTEALKIKPDDYEILKRRGNAYCDKGDIDRAIADYTEALKIKPDDDEILSYGILKLCGLVLEEYGNSDRAIALYAKILKIKPDNYNVLSIRGDAYRDKGDFNRAIADYTELLRIKPNDNYALNCRGDVYRDKGDFDNAIADYTELLRINTDDVNALKSRGDTYCDKGDLDRAIADYTEALKRYEQNRSFDSFFWREKFLEHRGKAYADKGDFDRAIADYTEMLKKRPNNDEILRYRGIAYAGKGDFDLAIEDFEAVLKINPNNAKAKKSLRKIRPMKKTVKKFFSKLWEDSGDLRETTLKILIYVCRIILCLVFVGLWGFLCYEIIEILTIVDKLNGWLILIAIALIAGCIAGCIASIYYLFNGYAIYIGEKILRLYNKPDGEYVIISDSKWLFWLPIFYKETTDIICWRWGIKAKKNGNILELNGIKERHIPYTFRFIFCKDKYKDFIKFNQFGCIPSKQADDDRNWGRKHSEQTYDWIFFAYRSDLVSGNGVWLFKLIRKKGDYYPPNECYDFEQAYENASEHSRNQLMGIYFGGVNYNEVEKIIYNIITQIDENKIIRKEIEENRIIEYYHNYEYYVEYYPNYYCSSIAKVTNTKEGFYFYRIYDNAMYLNRFNIKNFMQMSGIYPRGLFEYGDESDGGMIYCLNGNYFRSLWYKIEVEKSISIEPITLEKYSKILEDDCKYQIEKKNLEEKRRKIIYNIITQTGENEIVFADSKEEKHYYYREKHPAYDEYSSISKEYTSYRIEGWEFKNFNIEEFMQLNDIHYEKFDEKTDYFPYYKKGSSYRINENYIFAFIDKPGYRYSEIYGPYPIDNYKQTQTLKLEKKKPVPKSAVEYQLPKKYILPRKIIAVLATIIFTTFGLFLYRVIDNQNYFSDKVPLYSHIIDFGSTISSAITDYTEANVYEKLFNRGNAYFKEGNYDQAIEDYTAVLRIKPNLHAALYNRGLVYWNKGNYDRAIEDFEAVLKIDPNNVKAKENLEKIRRIEEMEEALGEDF